ncbi:MAG: 50S ribosomal protein L17 [Clostridiales bacterium]|nr:50S ribosomal protein L17 [Clostridiales bacterium]
MVTVRLGRARDPRRALLRGLVTSFFAHEAIVTTEAKARETQRLAERLITKAKRGDLHARRQVAAYLLSEDVLKKLFDEVAPRYKERAGGYTRIIKLPARRGDGAPMARLELI